MRRSLPSLLLVIAILSWCGALGACQAFGGGDGGDGGAGPTADAGPGDAASRAPIPIAKEVTLPSRIASDSSHVYVTTRGTPAAVLKIAHDGSTSVVFASGLASAPSAISVGPVYTHWLTNTEVWARAKIADRPALSMSTSSRPTALATHSGGAIVFANEGASSALGGLLGASATFDSSSFLATLPGIVSLAALGDDVVYVGIDPTPDTDGIRRYDKGTPSNASLPRSGDSFGAVTAIAANADRIVFAEASGAVHELKTSKFVSVGGSVVLAKGGAVVGIVLDEVRRSSYWMTADGAVHRHDWESAQVSDDARGCASPGGIAQDDAHLYWTCPNEGTVAALAK